MPREHEKGPLRDRFVFGCFADCRVRDEGPSAESALTPEHHVFTGMKLIDQEISDAEREFALALTNNQYSKAYAE